MPDLIDTMRLVEQVSARLCHDLSGPIGTVGGALDLLIDDIGSAGAGDNEYASFAVAASRDLAQRLRLLRAAWGPEASPMTVAELRALADGPLAARRIGLVTSSMTSHDPFPTGSGRLVLNLVLVAADGLPKGGVIMLSGAPDDVFVLIRGPNAEWPAGLTACAQNEAAAIDALTSARTLQMPLTALLVLSQQRRLSPVMGPLPGGGSGIAAWRLSAT